MKIRDVIWFISIGAIAVLGVLKLSDGKASIKEVDLLRVSVKDQRVEILHRLDTIDKKLDNIIIGTKRLR